MFYMRLIPLLLLACFGRAQVYDLDWNLTKGETWLHEDAFEIDMMSFIPGMPRTRYTIVNRATCQVVDLPANGDIGFLFTFIDSRLEGGPETVSKFGVEALIGIPFLVVFHHDRSLTVTPKKPIPRDGHDQFDITYQSLSMLQTRLFDVHRAGLRPGSSWTSRNVASFKIAEFVQDLISDATYTFKGESTFEGRKTLELASETQFLTTFNQMEGDVVSVVRETFQLDAETRYLLQLKSVIRQKGVLKTPNGEVSLDFLVHQTSTARKTRGEN